MAKINDLPLLPNPTEDMYCLVGKEDLQKVPWSAIMGQIGAPYIATTVAGMTDKTRVYVYQGSESGLQVAIGITGMGLHGLLVVLIIRLR